MIGLDRVSIQLDRKKNKLSIIEISISDFRQVRHYGTKDRPPKKKNEIMQSIPSKAITVNSTNKSRNRGLIDKKKINGRFRSGHLSDSFMTRVLFFLFFCLTCCDLSDNYRFFFFVISFFFFFNQKGKGRFLRWPTKKKKKKIVKAPPKKRLQKQVPKKTQPRNSKKKKKNTERGKRARNRRRHERERERERSPSPTSRQNMEEKESKEIKVHRAVDK